MFFCQFGIMMICCFSPFGVGEDSLSSQLGIDEDMFFSQFDVGGWIFRHFSIDDGMVI